MMVQSSKPRKQRLFRYTAPLHVRQHFLHVHLDKKLKDKFQIKKRSVQVSKGDSVKVMTGSNKGKEGKVMSVSLRSGRILIDTIKRKNAKGKELHIPIYASNVYITELSLEDKMRAAKLNLKQVKTEKKQAPAAVEAPKPTAEKAEKPPLQAQTKVQTVTKT
jgi:large subunit ribosomal protein L24